MRLAHLHLPKHIPYAHSLRLQDIILEEHLKYNSFSLRSQRDHSQITGIAPIQPPPTLLTFQTDPVYTVGRRHLKANPLTKAQVEFLTTNKTSPDTNNQQGGTPLATFYASPRGGLLTYHAPGQLTAYLIINLRSHAITPRCFIRLLENTVIRTCGRHGVPNTLITEDPGVWIGEAISEQKLTGIIQTAQEHQALKATTRKVCAIGVHVTRGITSHGIGLNVVDSPILNPEAPHLYELPRVQEHEKSALAPGYLSWGFSRIIACGLEGKSVTWLANEGADTAIEPGQVANTLAEEVCKSLSAQGRIDVTGIDRLVEQDVLPKDVIEEPGLRII